MTRRPLCLLCLALMLFLCVADRAGLPLIRGNPVPENTASWIEKHPQATVCGEVLQTTENEFTQSVYLSNTYLIYQPKKNQSKENQPKKISIENVKVFLKKKEVFGRKHGLMYKCTVIVLKFIKTVMNRRNQTGNI